jgi:diguanylate cyclase (GGDEF)-like protein
MTAGMAAGTAALLHAPMARGPVFETSVAVPWIVLALAFAAFEVQSLSIRFRGETHIFNLNEIVVVLGLLVASPSQLVLAELLGAGLVLGLYRRLRPLKLAFNCAQFACTTAAAATVFRVIADPATPLGPRSWFAALLGVTVAAVMGQLAITTALLLTQGRVPLTGIAASQMFGMASAVVNTMLGLVVAIVLDASMVAGVLLAGPIIAVFVSYRAYLSEHSKSEGLQFLYGASELLGEAKDAEAGLLALLDYARTTFAAEIAQVVLRGEPDETIGYCTCMGPGNEGFRLEPVAREHVEAVLEIAGASGDAVLYQPADGASFDTLEGVAVHTMLVATLHDESGTRGAVLVARARGAVVESFDKDEMRLFETFVNHLGTTMEKTRLSASLAQLRALKQELAHQAYHDSLTGLANRLKFRDLVDDALADAAREAGKVAVLFIDLDDFKIVNDTMGHGPGDRLLEEVARRIAHSVGELGTAARLGGDEFAVLLPMLGNDSEARGIADRILVALGDPVSIDGQLVIAQASIGIATHVGAADASELMQHADVAMYTAKRNGKGRFDEFEPNMSLSVARRHQLKVGLARALANDELVLHYQPVIDARGGAIVGTEALVRWKNPERGLMPPTEFVGVAEETGLIVPIGRYVLREACRQAAEWTAVIPDLRVFVNLSTRQLADADIVDDVRHALENGGLNASQLVLEVTETAMMQDIDEAKATLYALKALGVAIAIDDFGTGFSSLSYLRELPIDLLKIAQPIIDAICESEQDAAFVKGIIELGHVVGLKVIAEGVEHVEQFAALLDMSCDLVQGYYYAPSMEPAELQTVLAGAGTNPALRRRAEELECGVDTRELARHAEVIDTRQHA